MVWFTSDLHLGHRPVIEFCSRPYRTIQEMDADLVDRWNKAVKPKDIIYCLGDVSFHIPAIGVPLLSRLKGNKILVQGNHDKYSETQYRTAGFEVVQEAVIQFKGQRVRLSHYPPLITNSDDPYDKRRLDIRPAYNSNEWVLCGHVHNRWKQRERVINIGVDVWGYSPVSGSVIERLMNQKPPKIFHEGF